MHACVLCISVCACICVCVGEGQEGSSFSVNYVLTLLNANNLAVSESSRNLSVGARPLWDSRNLSVVGARPWWDSRNLSVVGARPRWERPETHTVLPSSRCSDSHTPKRPVAQQPSGSPSASSPSTTPAPWRPLGSQVSTSLSLWLGIDEAKDKIPLVTQELCSSLTALCHRVGRLGRPGCLQLLPRCLQMPNNKKTWPTGPVAGVTRWPAVGSLPLSSLLGNETAQ